MRPPPLSPRASLTGLCTSALLAATATHAAPPANDACVNAAAITGSGLHPFDLTEATTGNEGVISLECDFNGAGIEHDIWYCWTSTCNGQVEFSTCGLTLADTKIRIYDGCACPSFLATPRCCSDDDCDVQTRVVCDVVCGQTYLVQLGTTANAPGAPGTLKITCLGQECGDGGGGPSSCDCCAERPPIVDAPGAPFVPFVSGIIAAATNSPFGLNDPSVYVVELGNEGSAPLGGNWTAAQRYSHPSWTLAKLGHVFGVTIDDGGNIYVAHTSCYSNGNGDVLGSLGGAGSIYRLDGGTGNATELIRLPNSIDPAIAPGQPNEAYPGLGNLCFDCGSGRIFAANLEDGRLYSIDPNGGNTKVKSTFDVATGTITGALPNNGLAEPGDRPGWVPLGQRPYAVKSSGGRLYYSVWAGSILQNPPVQFFSGGVNTIRSVAIDANGNFLAATDQLEITLPPFLGFGGSCPVADISFDSDCCMYVAERGLSEIATFAHAARVLRYCFDPLAGWGAPFEYQVGEAIIGPYGNLNSSTGGVGVDLSTGIVWTMGDALKAASLVPPFYYGIEGQSTAGAPTTSSILIDLDGITNVIQKYFLGSLEITCAQPACAALDTAEILCREDGSYTWTFTLTNTSGSTASVLILPDPSFSPNVIPFNPPLASGATSAPITVTISGQQPGSQFCFDLVLGDVKGNECCHLVPCIELPDCDCAQISNVAVQATSTPGVFTLSFNLTNLEAWTMGHSTLFPTGGSGAVNPALWSFPGVPPFGTQAIGPVTITSGLVPGDTFCLTIGQHSTDWLKCCFIQLCVTVPNQAAASLPSDLNADGHVDGADLAILLGSWSTAGPGDLDGDGIVGAADLAILLGAWGG